MENYFLYVASVLISMSAATKFVSVNCFFTRFFKGLATHDYFKCSFKARDNERTISFMYNDGISNQKKDGSASCFCFFQVNDSHR